MPRRVSASEAKTRFGAIADWAVESQDGIIVKSHGQPKQDYVAQEGSERTLSQRLQVPQVRPTAGHGPPVSRPTGADHRRSAGERRNQGALWGAEIL
jgi:hypothetical protein